MICTLNTSTGPIRCQDLEGVSEDEIATELADQVVVQVRSTTSYRDNIKGYLNVPVDMYIPNPNFENRRRLLPSNIKFFLFNYTWNRTLCPGMSEAMEARISSRCDVRNSLLGYFFKLWWSYTTFYFINVSGIWRSNTPNFDNSKAPWQTLVWFELQKVYRNKQIGCQTICP